MNVDATTDPKFEIGHVLFIDIVGYSTLLINEQSRLLRELNEVVRQSAQFRRAEAEGNLMRLPTGDGMALVFRDSAESPVECALEVSRTVHKRIPVRMGVHSGPVNEVFDVNNRTNLAGAGINMAQRIMDCGDAGHILLSKRVAEDLEQYARWKPYLHYLGECEVKHAVRVAVVNLHTPEAGNPHVPEKLKPKQKRTDALRAALAERRWKVVVGLFLSVIGLIVGVWIVAHLFPGATHRTGGGIAYANRSYENAKWTKIYGADRLFPAKASFHNVGGWDRRNLVVTGDIDNDQLSLRLENGEWKVERPQKVPGHATITACRMIGPNRFVFLRLIKRGTAELDLWDANGSRKLGDAPFGSSLYALAPDIFCGMDERLGYWKYSGNALQQFEKTARESFILQNDNAVAQVKNPRWNKDEPMMVANIRDVSVFSGGKAIGLWSTPSGNCATVRYRDGRWYLVAEVTGFSSRNVPNKAWFLDEKNFIAIGSDKIGRCIDGKLTLQDLEISGLEYPANALTIVWGHDLNHYWVADLLGNVFGFDGAHWKLVAHGPELKDLKKFEALWPAPNGSVVAVTADEVYALE
jgi:class 3 adenylate cyclase